MAHTYEDKLTLAAFNNLGNEPGTCKVVWGSYAGTGKTVSNYDTAIKLTFPGRPLYVEVWPQRRSSEEFRYKMYHGVTTADHCSATYDTVHTYWGDNWMAFHAEGRDSLDGQMNYKETIYYHVALIAI